MTLHVPHLTFSLDPLIAEAKRRMRRRRFLLAAIVIAGAGVVVALTLSLRPGSHSLTLAPTDRVGIARIPGMTLVASDHSKVICSLKGTDLQPQWCDQAVTRGLDQTWAVTEAVTRYGIHRAGGVLPVAFARQHPGPARSRSRSGRSTRGKGVILLRNCYTPPATPAPTAPTTQASSHGPSTTASLAALAA